MSHSAWTHLRHTRSLLFALLAAGGGGLAGLWLGFGLLQMMGPPLDRMAVPLAVAIGILVAVTAFFGLRALGRRCASRLEKGEGAGTSTDHAIEYALAGPDCAVAHSVTGIARAANIDHLVATPVRLWVIGTQYQPVPREQLPEVLRQIADNTTAVWDWAPPGTPVRGCLILGCESRLTRNQYDFGKGPIVVHTPATLARELKAEAEQAREIDERVATKVWDLRRNSG